MFNYSLDTFISHTKTSKVVPISRTYVYDVDSPIRALYHFIDEPNLVFLESLSETLKHNRYSYLAFDAYEHIACHSDEIVSTIAGKTNSSSENLYDYMESKLDYYKAIPKDSEPYAAGLLGTVSYECVKFLEKIDLPKLRTLNTPLAEYIVPRTLLIFDNFKNRVTIVRSVFMDEIMDATHAYSEAVSKIEALKDTLYSELSNPPLPLGDPIENYEDMPHETTVDRETFMKHVKTCKAYIRAGDIFQIQVSRRCSIMIDAHPIMLYRYLRNYNPSPFMFYVQFNENTYVGASPELLVNVDDRQACIRPIAGTRKRYSKEKTEAEIITELQTDEKEVAEHVMLVDLARHDIGRTCKIGTVAVSELMVIEKYTHVMHMVSDVVGDLQDKYSSVDAFKYGFPAGTVAGAPKIRAMEIIADLETEQREFYSGGVVFFDFKGNLKSALSIRTLMVKDGIAYTQAAGGIVADSIPEMEYKETEHKMKACLAAMHKFRRAS